MEVALLGMHLLLVLVLVLVADQREEGRQRWKPLQPLSLSLRTMELPLVAAEAAAAVVGPSSLAALAAKCCLRSLRILPLLCLLAASILFRHDDAMRPLSP